MQSLIAVALRLVALLGTRCQATEAYTVKSSETGRINRTMRELALNVTRYTDSCNRPQTREGSNDRRQFTEVWDAWNGIDLVRLLWYTREKIGHATIRIVFKLTGKESDSGVFIRIPERPTEPWMPVNRGYEVEIGDWPDDYSCTGVLYTFTKALARPIKPIGEWNLLEITIDGPRTTVYLNGIKVTDFTEGQPVPPKHPGSSDPDRGPRQDSGYIGLQNHPGSEVYFKEVSIEPLSQ